MTCSCLCGTNHKMEPDICTGKEERIIGFQGTTFGRTAVAMCSPCAEATILQHKFEKAGEADGEVEND